MLKVTAFLGSARKKHTYHAVERFMKNLQSFGDVECEMVSLGDYNLKICRGCLQCLNNGEELCPLKDDRDVLIKKLVDSDGIVLASPNYSFQVSGLMKVFLDRLGFMFHRPRFFGKTYTGIVAQGIYGGDKIVKYLDFIGNGLGCNVVEGSCVMTREPVPEKQRLKNERMIDRQSRKFHAQLVKKEFPNPSLLWIMIFRMSRTSIRLMLNEDWRDYNYYRDKGWFESEYFYPVKINPLKKLIGWLSDLIAVRMAKSDMKAG